MKLYTKKYTITGIVNNEYVIGGSYKDFFAIPKGDIDEYGEPISVTAKNYDGSAALATFVDETRTSCTFSFNSTLDTVVFVTFAKFE